MTVPTGYAGNRPSHAVAQGANFSIGALAPRWRWVSRTENGSNLVLLPPRTESAYRKFIHLSLTTTKPVFKLQNSQHLPRTIQCKNSFYLKWRIVIVPLFAHYILKHEMPVHHNTSNAFTVHYILYVGLLVKSSTSVNQPRINQNNTR